MTCLIPYKLQKVYLHYSYHLIKFFLYTFSFLKLNFWTLDSLVNGNSWRCFNHDFTRFNNDLSFINHSCLNTNCTARYRIRPVLAVNCNFMQVSNRHNIIFLVTGNISDIRLSSALI
ncbi:SET domain-containing protein-lysine N-methyltransferase [Methanobrevibacter thaueri]|uniref:SET domain-containing protein-lysine N-methyltransferase n=1 Tax=Methanobrevibacter thaueri TaxID=190975 RepID=UPI0034E06376